jgi:hypothetical protein
MLSVSQDAAEACGGVVGGAVAAIAAVESNRMAATIAPAAILEPLTRMRILLLSRNYSEIICRTTYPAAS